MIRMMLLILIGVCTAFEMAKGGHISGGELYYRYIGVGSTPGTREYEVTLRLFRDCTPISGTGGTGIAAMPTLVILGVYDNSTNASINNGITVNRTRLDNLTLLQPFSCIVNPPTVCYEVGYFITTITLPDNTEGYTISYETCCRINGISNATDGAGQSPGATYSANIPGSRRLGANVNSSPIFSVKDTALVCRGKNFTLDFSASDADGDSLSYSFCNAFQSGGPRDANARLPQSPPYSSLFYLSPYSGTNPLGSEVRINPATGLISGRAPSGGIVNVSGASFFVVNVCVDEWRNGVIISQHRKDFIVRVGSCDFADAELPISIINCDGYTNTFENLTTSSLIKTWNWSFGDGNTSTAAIAQHTYADTGTYKVQLIVNKDSVCSDTAETVLRVYPGFTPGFEVRDGCQNRPIQFTDTSKTRFGTVNYWKWDFGNPAATNDTARIRNPQYTYAQLGTFNISLIVSTDKGCIDTVQSSVNIVDKPPIQLTNDTLICTADTLQLRAIGDGVFSWSPNYMISDTNIPNPLVSPDVATKYYVTLTNGPGCVNIDSVLVRADPSVILTMPQDTIICRSDQVVLRPQTNGLQYSWSPANLIQDAGVRNAVARPTDPVTTFTLISRLGICNTSGTVTVRTVPYPTVSAGNDAIICASETITLNATGNASSFIWSPARFVRSYNSASTVAQPTVTTNFIVRATDNLGCPKPVFDTVLITVVPPVNVFAGNDTTVVVGQPLQLNGIGAVGFNWLPPTYLDNPNISNPIATFDGSREYFTYVLRTTSAEGCTASDTMTVRIFRTAPDIFVPTAFTPNRNGLNDVFKPIPVGISTLQYFRVYNRWGQLLYSTSVMNDGWDGLFRGREQAPDTYVWTVSGTDFAGNVITKKGTVVLIR